MSKRSEWLAAFKAAEANDTSITHTGVSKEKAPVSQKNMISVSVNLDFKLQKPDDYDRLLKFLVNKAGWSNVTVTSDTEEKEWSDEYDLDDPNCPDFGINNIEALGIHIESFYYYRGKCNEGSIEIVYDHDITVKMESQYIIMTIYHTTRSRDDWESWLNRTLKEYKNKKTAGEKEYRYFLLDADLSWGVLWGYKYYDAKDNEIVKVTANYGGQGPGSAAPDFLHTQDPPANFDYSDASPLESIMPIRCGRIDDLTGADQEAFRKFEDRYRGC